MNQRIEQQTPTFGLWMEEPNGDGIYEFDGKRDLPAGHAFVTTHCLVEVSTMKMPRAGDQYKQVRYFGRGHHFRLKDFHGRWRKLKIELRGEVGL